MQTVELSPVDSALLDVEEHVKELSQLQAKFEVFLEMDNAASTNDLTMALNEIVDAPPENGLEFYRTVFFTPDYLDGHPSQEASILKLRQALDELVSFFSLFMQLASLRSTTLLGIVYRR